VSSFPLHEVRSLLSGPGSLSLIEYHDLLYGYVLVADILISKVMDILDKAAHLTLSHRLLDSLSANFVASKRLTKHVNERAVAGQEDGIFIAVFVRASRRKWPSFVLRALGRSP